MYNLRTYHLYPTCLEIHSIYCYFKIGYFLILHYGQEFVLIQSFPSVRQYFHQRYIHKENIQAPICHIIYKIGNSRMFSKAQGKSSHSSPSRNLVHCTECKMIFLPR